MTEIFTGNFTQQEPILDEAIAAAIAVMQHGRLHRYNEAAGEVAEAALLEQEFAAQMGARYCLAVASGGYALATALRALGVKPGDRVLTNAFTLAPVPGAIASVGAVPVFVGVTEGLVIDLEDLASKADQADVLMLSHMRGHIVDMDALIELAQAHDLKVVEDCAHTMGAKWGETWSGRSGIIGCYSCQTYKHVNSGEGGLMLCDDDEIMARAIMLSGSYMLYGKHRAGPPIEAFEAVRLVTPNVSGRMDNLRAAILRPQLRQLEAQCTAWNDRYQVVDQGLAQVVGLTRIQRPQQEKFVASSYQFLLLDWSSEAIRSVIGALFGARCRAQMVWRSRSGWFHQPLRQLDLCAEHGHAKKAIEFCTVVIDMRLPLTFSLDDCATVARIIAEGSGACGSGGVRPLSDLLELICCAARA